MTDKDFYKKLKWLTFFRVLFTTLLLGSSIILEISGKSSSPLAEPLLRLYGLIAGVFVLSFCYSLILKVGLAKNIPEKARSLFAYIQISIDTFVVTLIIFMTGGFSSVFSFLYLVVIIYASMLVFRKGSMIMAALCSIQYGVMVDLEFYGILNPFGMEGGLAYYYPWSHVIFKILMIMVACFAVAFLSSLLAEQERRTKKELRAMEDHVKRVEQMAVVGEMAAGLAHEIKNPIASLRGSIQLLREDIPYDPDHDKLMTIVLRETDRLSALVSDFLLFARPPAGRVEVFDMGEALRETVALFERDRTCCGRISVVKAVLPDIWIQMDPAHLHQIFWNLLLNAAEAIKGTGNILIEMDASRNRQVGVRVSDTGCGMSEDAMRCIFNPFVTTKPQGSGLGLSIVHRIVESYDGRLDVESEIDRGTTFTLTLKRI